MALKTYRELEVWQKAIDLVEVVYRLTECFPRDECFGLKSQVQEAAISVPANIAEGYARCHRGDYLHHLSFAKGSLAEVETHLVIATRLKFVNREQALPAWHLAQVVGRLLNKLISSLQDNRGMKPRALNPEPRTLNPEP